MKMTKRTKLRLAVLVILPIAAIVLVWWLTHPTPAPPYFRPNSQFAIGINYPWHNYGGDFGTSVWGAHVGISTERAHQDVDADFEHISRLGFKVVRWFIFCDGRGGLQFGKDEGVSGIDAYVIADMRAALDIAHKHNVRIIFVLLDFNFAQKSVWLAGSKVGGHRKIIENPLLTASYHNNALEPILKAFGNDSNVAAWELINEPEWVMTASPYWQKSKISEQKMQLFVRTTALFIKARAKQPVTVGSASLKDLDFWTDCALDFLQFHSYPSSERRYPPGTPVSDLGYELPVVLGEFPTDNSKFRADQYFDLMYGNGYLGALAWSFRASDKYSNLAKQAPAISAWQMKHRQDNSRVHVTP